jgi:DNA repair exonuclease SbcCD ATPase subunit
LSFLARPRRGCRRLGADDLAAAAKALRSAIGKDPSTKAAKDAQKAYDARRQEKLANLPEAGALAAKRQALRQRRQEADEALRAARDALGALRKKLQGADDPELAAARQAVADARKAPAPAAGTGGFAVERSTVEQADQALQARIREVLAADREHQALAREIQTVHDEMKDIDRRIGELRSKPRPLEGTEGPEDF